ncbi:MAG TPA: hypothetical protein VK457_09660 [Chloroflexota bacterium]|nr:hypothetical protein [Chloroflexota bacterium]
MLGLSPKDAWLVALLLISVGGYLAAARWSSRLADGRPIVMYSVGFSLAFVLLALATGLAVIR